MGIQQETAETMCKDFVRLVEVDQLGTIGGDQFTRQSDESARLMRKFATIVLESAIEKGLLDPQKFQHYMEVGSQ